MTAAYGVTGTFLVTTIVQCDAGTTCAAPGSYTAGGSSTLDGLFRNSATFAGQSLGSAVTVNGKATHATVAWHISAYGGDHDTGLPGTLIFPTLGAFTGTTRSVQIFINRIPTQTHFLGDKYEFVMGKGLIPLRASNLPASSTRAAYAALLEEKEEKAHDENIVDPPGPYSTDEESAIRDSEWVQTDSKRKRAIIDLAASVDSLRGTSAPRR